MGFTSTSSSHNRFIHENFIKPKAIQVAVKSLETVLERFILLAEQKTLEAQKHSIEKIEEIDDLDVADAPEK